MALPSLKSLFGLGGTSSFVLGWSIPTSSWGKTRQLQEYRRYIHSIVSAIAEDVARAELFIKRNEREVPDHPLLKLLRRPNPDTSQFQFLELHETYMQLSGESFWYLVYPNKVTKKPSEIYLLRPDMMKVAIGEDEKGLVTGYTLTKPDGTDIPFEKHEIIHHKLPNPLNPYRGMSIVEAAQWYVQTEEFTADWVRNAIHNSGRPSGIVSIKGTINGSDFENIKKRFKQEYSGTGNAGKTMFVRAQQGIEYSKLGMELGDLALKEMKDVSKEDLMMMWRVSKTMLGITDDVNRANARESRAVWLQNVIQPKVWRLVDQLDASLLPRYGSGDSLDFKSNVPADHAEAREDFKSGLITLNEARLTIGAAPLPEGDIRYMPLNMVRQDQKSNRNNEEKSVIKKEVDANQKEVYRKEVFVRQETWEKKYKGAVTEAFEAQKKEILDKNKKAIGQWGFDTVKSKEKFKELLTPISIELMIEQAQAALEFAGDDDTQFLISERVQKFIDERIELFVDETNAETLQAIQDTISQGIQAGESVQKLRKRIEEVYAEATTTRAERIARTETIAASNEAALEAYSQSPVVTKKEWLTEPDGCAYCATLDGTIIGLQANFAARGQQLEGTDGTEMTVDYTDISSPPLHPNCRCTILPVSSVNLSADRLVTLMKQYQEMDKRTREAKKLLKEIAYERELLNDDRKELNRVIDEFEEALDG